MSTTDVPIEDGIDETAVPVIANGHSASLRERLAARRRELERDRTFVIPVIGYEDLGICARYRVLPYEGLRRIGERHKRSEGTAQGELGVAADTLVNACVELMERDEAGDYSSLGVPWSREAAEELFGIHLPDGATARSAIFAIFAGPAGSTNLMLHFRDYDSMISGVAPEVDDVMRGESESSSAASSS